VDMARASRKVAAKFIWIFRVGHEKRHAARPDLDAPSCH
jgi:hypothetical protein